MLRILCFHSCGSGDSCGAGATPGPGTSASCCMAKKKKKKKSLISRPEKIRLDPRLRWSSFSGSPSPLGIPVHSTVSPVGRALFSLHCGVSPPQTVGCGAGTMFVLLWVPLPVLRPGTHRASFSNLMSNDSALMLELC